MKRYVVIFAAASCMAGGVQAAPRGVPVYFDPATRIFVPIQRQGQVDPATSTYTTRAPDFPSVSVNQL